MQQIRTVIFEFYRQTKYEAFDAEEAIKHIPSNELERPATIDSLRWLYRQIFEYEEFVVGENRQINHEAIIRIIAFKIAAECIWRYWETLSEEDAHYSIDAKHQIDFYEMFIRKRYTLGK